MANKKIKHIIAKLLGETTEETLDIYDESALHATDIVDNLTSNDATKVLSAKQGKALNDSITSTNSALTNGLASKLNASVFTLVSFTNFKIFPEYNESNNLWRCTLEFTFSSGSKYCLRFTTGSNTKTLVLDYYGSGGVFSRIWSGTLN